MKKELLLPAGSMEALKNAVHNGAYAVYVGGKKFGARAFAPNFTEEDLSIAVKYCHLYDVKLYVTVNIMVFERELEEVMEYVRFLYSIGIDALIISDLGLISLIHKELPDFEMHLSTQAHTFQESQMYFWKDLGIKRIVVDREMSLEEIETLPDILDIEIFIHGALCVCFSGQCYMSFLNLTRSGNRGSCAGLCRLPYELYKGDELIETNGQYLLSTKELNTSKRIKELMNSKVKSFKVEGRMKSPEYVAFIGNFYRKLMNELKVSETDEKDLSSLYNRDFTEGYLFKNDNIMNFKTSNHQGILLGKVLEVTNKKIKIKLDEDIYQEDGIRFIDEEKGMIVNFLYNERGLLIHEAKKGSIIEVDNKIGLKNPGLVRKTIDKKLMDSLKEMKEKKIKIEIDVKVSIPKVTIKVSDSRNVVELSEDIAEVAKNQPMTEEMILKQIQKLGNTPFICENPKIEILDEVFMPVAKLNELRRNVLDELIKLREQKIEGDYNV